MMFRTGCLFITLLVGSIAFPLNEEKDMSIFFDHQATDPFIIGGTVAADRVPHMVALTIGILTKSFLFGGSIISERVILTAAHCIRPVISSSLLRSIRVNVGSNRWATGIEYNIIRAIEHPDYIHDILKNDIGLFITANAIAFTENVQPVVLNYDFIGGNVPAIANGWGKYLNVGPPAQILNELRPVTVHSQQCLADMARIVEEQNASVLPIDPEIEICTFLEFNRGMCHGDSGSPLILAESKEQIGVVSWGMPCAMGAPDIFVRVSAYQSWLEQQLGQITI